MSLILQKSADSTPKLNPLLAEECVQVQRASSYRSADIFPPAPGGWNSNTVSLKAAWWDGWAESWEWRIEQAVCWFQEEMFFHYFLFLWFGLIVITDNKPLFHIHHFNFIIWWKMFTRKKDLFLYFSWIFMINFILAKYAISLLSLTLTTSRRPVKFWSKKKKTKRKNTYFLIIIVSPWKSTN